MAKSRTTDLYENAIFGTMWVMFIDSCNQANSRTTDNKTMKCDRKLYTGTDSTDNGTVLVVLRILMVMVIVY